MARKRNPASGAKGTGNQQKAKHISKGESAPVGKRQTTKQAPEAQSDRTTTTQRRKKSTSQSQNDRHDPQEPQSHGNDVSNDDEDAADEDENDDDENSSEGEAGSYDESFLNVWRKFERTATFERASEEMASFEEKLKKLASTERRRALSAGEERDRRNASYALRSCMRRLHELDRSPSGPANTRRNTTRKEATSQKRGTSPLWEHDPKKWWPVREILEDCIKGRFYRICWAGTDKYGNAWPDQWIPRRDVEEATLEDYLAEKKERALLKRRQAAKRRREANKKTAAKGKTTDGSGDDEDDGDEDYQD